MSSGRHGVETDAEVRDGYDVVAIPYPGRGHVNPMMNLCKLLADRGLIITFVVTDEWLGLLGTESRPPNLRVRSIPNVLPSELDRAADFPGFLEAVYTRMEAPVDRLLTDLRLSVTCIIADTYVPWAIGLGRRRNIPVVSLWPMPPAMFSVVYHVDLLRSNGVLPLADLAGREDDRIDYLPGIMSVRLADLYPIISQASARSLYGVDVLMKAYKAVSSVRKADCLLLTCGHELEPRAVDAVSSLLAFPVYAVGPCIPHIRAHPPGDSADYSRWLDDQPPCSVLYVSLGSFLSVTGDQMEELAAGLVDSGARFLWVVRGDSSRLQEVRGEGRMTIPWCDQLEVLSHPSVAGFLTHCGWNSTMEAVFAGVPMLTFPIFWDQGVNAKLVVDDWGIGLRLKEKAGDESLVGRGEIARLVRLMMDTDDESNKTMRARAIALQEQCQRAVKPGGSSCRGLDAFLTMVDRFATRGPGPTHPGPGTH